MEVYMKKISLLISVILLSLVMIIPIHASEIGFDNFQSVCKYENQFTDVKSSDWFYSNVSTAFSLGLVNGVSDTYFNQAGNITVAQTIALAARIHNIYYANECDFTQGTPWYQVYVDYAVSYGIINSGEYSDYNATATRAQFARIIAKSLPEDALEPINTVNSIPDVLTSYQSGPSVFLLYRAGILTGNDKYGTFAPNSNIKRSEVATIVTRMVKPELRKSFVLEEKKTVLYASDGRMIEVPDREVDANVSIGWHKEKPSMNPVKTGEWSYFSKTSGKWAQYANGYVVISGKGEYDSYPETPWDNPGNTVSISFARGITGVSGFDLKRCTKLGHVEIPDTVTTIDEYAFSEAKLYRIGVPSSVTKWECGSTYTKKPKDEYKNCTVYCEQGSYAEDQCIKYGIKHVAATMIYYPDGRTMMVSDEEKPVYLKNGWNQKPVIYIYNENGASKVIVESDFAQYKKDGWYDSKDGLVFTMYSLDGRTKEVFKGKVAAEKKAGWYMYPDYVCAVADSKYNAGHREEALTYLEGIISSSSTSAENKKTFEAKRNTLSEKWYKSSGCPIAIITTKMSSNSIGTPEASIKLRNLTGKTIVDADVCFTCYDAYGRVTTDYPYLYNGSFTGSFSASTTLVPYEDSFLTWTLYSNTSTRSVGNIYIKRCAFSDGTTWGK